MVSHKRQMKQNPADADNKVLTSLALKYVWSAFTRPDHEYGIMAEEQGLSVEISVHCCQSNSQDFLLASCIPSIYQLSTQVARHYLADIVLIASMTKLSFLCSEIKVSWCNFTMLLLSGG